MSDIFREVDEEVRRDKALEYWKRHGAKFALAALAIVAAVAGWRVYDTYTFEERAARGARFESAIAEIAAGRAEGNAGLTALAGERDGSYPALARFRLAGELAASARDEAARANAVSAFDALAADAGLPALWRELAKLRAAFILVDHGDFAEVERRLAPMSAPGQPFRHSAREGIALAAYRTGQADKALDALQAIILDSEAPAALRQRAELLLAVVRAGGAPKS
ncbi:MAG: tetratricopeptide repeat protein [Hyphomicrobiales bacterium]|nr:tetratricopeptide repeat protein [Hyphomicrobiales bacterium]